MRARSRASRGRKRPESPSRNSKTREVVSALVQQLGVVGLATLMRVTPRSVRRWQAGEARVSGCTGAFLGVLDRLRREWVYLDVLPGPLHVLVEDDYEVLHAVAIVELWAAWTAAHPDGVPDRPTPPHFWDSDAES